MYGPLTITGFFRWSGSIGSAGREPSRDDFFPEFRVNISQNPGIVFRIKRFFGKVLKSCDKFCQKVNFYVKFD